MSQLALVPSQSFEAIHPAALDAITGGFDFSQAVQAGNAAAGPGREAGQTLGAGFDAGYKAFTGKDSTIGATAGGPLGAAAGWVGGAATSTYQQLHGKR